MISSRTFYKVLDVLTCLYRVLFGLPGCFFRVLGIGLKFLGLYYKWVWQGRLDMLTATATRRKRPHTVDDINPALP